MKKFIYLLLMTPVFFISCSDDGDESEPILKQELPALSVIDVSQESEWDYWVIGKEDYYFIKSNLTSTLPESVFYHSSAINKDFSIFFNESGLVDRVVLEDHIFIFRNFNGNYVDLGVIYPDGKMETFRSVETPNYNWDTQTLSKSTNLKDFKSELIRWTGHTIAGIPCALSAAAAIPTGGLSLVTAGITCGIFLARLTGDIAENDFNIQNNLSEFVTTYDVANTLFSCVTLEAIECVHGSFSLAYDWLSEDHEELVDNSDLIQLVEIELNIRNFQSEFLNFDNNNIPDGWEFYKVRSADIRNERMNAYTNDGVASMIKTGRVSNSTQEIILEMDAHIAYSYWGLLNSFRIYSDDEYLAFYSGEEDYEFPRNQIANLISYKSGPNGTRIHESLSPSIPGTYHFKLIMNNSGYEFIGIDPNGQESFKINVDSNNYFNFNEIDKIEFGISAHTDNSGWMDNIKITVN